MFPVDSTSSSYGESLIRAFWFHNAFVDANDEGKLRLDNTFGMPICLSVLSCLSRLTSLVAANKSLVGAKQRS